MASIMGIDGCRAGWFAVIRTTSGWHTRLASSLQSLLTDAAGLSRILIDIPIGLADGHKRECDQLARRLLTPIRHTSVFSTPVRDAVYADDYASACHINARQTGTRITLQAWNICPKIREVDGFLRQHSKWSPKVYESHPEVAFYALNHCRPLASPKKSSEGQAERLALLAAHLDCSREIFEDAVAGHPRSELQKDDVIDALVLAVSAAQGEDNLVSLPDPPPLDRHGLPMRIVYANG